MEFFKRWPRFTKSLGKKNPIIKENISQYQAQLIKIYGKQVRFCLDIHCPGFGRMFKTPRGYKIHVTKMKKKRRHE